MSQIKLETIKFIMELDHYEIEEILFQASMKLRETEDKSGFQKRLISTIDKLRSINEEV